MKHYIFKIGAADYIASAGIEQTELGERSGYNKHEINRRLHKRGRLRATTAHKIAIAFADLAHISKDEAFSKLFEEAIE